MRQLWFKKKKLNHKKVFFKENLSRKQKEGRYTWAELLGSKGRGEFQNPARQGQVLQTRLWNHFTIISEIRLWPLVCNLWGVSSPSSPNWGGASGAGTQGRVLSYSLTQHPSIHSWQEGGRSQVGRSSWRSGPSDGNCELGWRSPAHLPRQNCSGPGMLCPSLLTFAAEKPLLPLSKTSPCLHQPLLTLLDTSPSLPCSLSQQVPSSSKWSEMKVTRLCLTLCDPLDYAVRGILQAKILECVAFPFSRGSSQPRNQTRVSCIVADSLPTELSGSK